MISTAMGPMRAAASMILHRSSGTSVGMPKPMINSSAATLGCSKHAQKKTGFSFRNVRIPVARVHNRLRVIRFIIIKKSPLFDKLFDCTKIVCILNGFQELRFHRFFS